MPVRQLSEAIVNRIAAGEVVERPASVVKELVENAIDAGAKRLDILTDGGGRRLIRVTDDGEGMTRADLALAVERHATSKLDDDDLVAIRTLGFRGEALPSIGAAARLTIATRHADEPHAWAIEVDAGRKSDVKPAALAQGTRVDVRDLFYATPARLKFLKTDRSEAEAVRDVVRRLAMSRPDVTFTLAGEERAPVTWSAAAEADPLARLGDVLGPEFRANAIAIDAERDGVHVTGFAGLPTLSRANTLGQYLFVNGRPVRDKLLIGAVRGAYADFLARDRHPALALFVDCDPSFVDVNVHPAKTEVRFRDAGLVRGLIVGALKHALSDSGHRASTTVAGAAMAAFQRQAPNLGLTLPSPRQFGALAEAPQIFQTPMSARVEEAPVHAVPVPNMPLGVARAQLHETYVVAQTADGIVIVDQHAAHERLVYERMKKALAEGGIARQPLLIPEVVEMDPSEVRRVSSRAAELAELGLVIEEFGPDAVVVREVPA